MTILPFRTWAICAFAIHVAVSVLRVMPISSCTVLLIVVFAIYVDIM